LTLKIAAITIVLLMAQFASADGLSWSGGLNLTEKEGQAALASRIEAFRGDNMVGYWVSSSNMLPQLVSDGMTYDMFVDFVGIDAVQSVEISPDNGLTVFPAENVPTKGYRIRLPADIRPGTYGFKAGVRSKDRRNRLVFLILPICWSSGRSSGMLQQLVVQSPPAGSNTYDDVMWFACMRGFLPAQASPDPNYIMQQKAVQQMLNPQPVATPVGTVTTTAPPVTTSTSPAEAPKVSTPEAAPAISIKPAGPNFPHGVELFIGHMKDEGFVLEQDLKSSNFRADVHKGDTLVVLRPDGLVRADLEVVGINEGASLTCLFTFGYGVKPGDRIEIHRKREGENR
jgi:hypothetical protein